MNICSIRFFSLNILFWIFIFLFKGLTPVGILFCSCATILLFISINDWYTGQIPLAGILLLALAGTVRMFLSPFCWQSHLTGFFTVSSMLMLCYILTHGRAIGGGDIKLMAAAGFFLGRRQSILAFCIGMLAAAFVCLVAALWKAKRQKTRLWKTHLPELPLAPFLTLGVYLAMLAGDQMITFFLRPI